MTQPGYSAMAGNSPHLNQHGPFTAINPQDRLVSPACLPFLSAVVTFVSKIPFIASQSHGIVCGSQKRQPLPLSPQNYPLHGSEVNGAHPAGVHSGSSSYGVPSHTPPIVGADTMMGELILAAQHFLMRLATQCSVPRCGISGMLLSTAPSSSSL